MCNGRRNAIEAHLPTQPELERLRLLQFFKPKGSREVLPHLPQEGEGVVKGKSIAYTAS